MVHPLLVELQNSIKSLLLQNTPPFSVIRKGYWPVSLSTLTRYKKKFLSSATLPGAGRRLSFVTVSTRQYIAKMLRNGKQNDPKTFQEYLRLIEIDMSTSVVRNLLKRMDFKQRKKNKANFISKKKTSLLGCDRPKNTSILR
jgi:transposase